MDEPYYKSLGWLSPTELIFMALEMSKVDTAMATMMSQLAVVRATNDSPDLEKELMEMIQKFLRSRIPKLDDAAKQYKAKYN